jgi:hypothetical protein
MTSPNKYFLFLSMINADFCRHMQTSKGVVLKAAYQALLLALLLAVCIWASRVIKLTGLHQRKDMNNCLLSIAKKKIVLTLHTQERVESEGFPRSCWSTPRGFATYAKLRRRRRYLVRSGDDELRTISRVFRLWRWTLSLRR